MKVVKKSGLVGVKVELYPTDKGFKYTIHKKNFFLNF